MTNDSTKHTFTLEPDFDEFDPLEDSEENDSDINRVSLTDERSAEERTADLMKAMAPRRSVLLRIMSRCTEPQPASAMRAYVDELQANNFSVYSAANLCALLEKAGAIERITADGELAEETEAEPDTVVVDGVEYFEAREPVEIYWRTTAPGLAALEADKPLDRLRALLDEDAVYAPIYQRILSLCSAEGGSTTPIINEAVDHDPLVQKPRFYAPHFIDRLEKCDALVWKKAWCITEIGRTGLNLLTDTQPTVSIVNEED